jgi:hypothetical protein
LIRWENDLKFVHITRLGLALKSKIRSQDHKSTIKAALMMRVLATGGGPPGYKQHERGFELEHYRE